MNIELVIEVIYYDENNSYNLLSLIIEGYFDLLDSYLGLLDDYLDLFLLLDDNIEGNLVFINMKRISIAP